MFIMAFKGFGNSFRSKTLWRIVFLSLVWFVWQERNERIFENKERSKKEVWDIFYFYSSLWADCTKALVRFLFQLYFLIGQRYVSLSFSFGFVSFCIEARKSLPSLVLSSIV